jgi:hypothetical protein
VSPSLPLYMTQLGDLKFNDVVAGTLPGLSGEMSKICFLSHGVT